MKKSRIFTLLVFTRPFSFSFCALVTTVPTSFCNDVTEDGWYYNIVCGFSEYGVFEGYSNGTFGSNQNITRDALSL